MKCRSFFNTGIAAGVVCTLLGAPTAVCAQDAKPSDDLIIQGYEKETANEIPVPPMIETQVSEIYDYFGKRWQIPRIDTTFNDKRISFVLRRTKEEIRDYKNTGASTVNFAPFDLGEQITRSSAHQKVCKANYYGFGNDKKGWCDEDKYSIIFYEHHANSWYFPMMVSHEFMHLRIREFQLGGTIDNYFPYWISEGIGNGFGFGFVEEFPRFSRQKIAQLTAPLPPGDNKIGAFLGLRYYDVPLSLEGRYANAFPYPRDHPAYPYNPAYPEAHVQMAGYGTGSFFRYALKGRGPKNEVAVMDSLLRKKMPPTSDADAWLRWIDGGLKSEKGGKPGKVWPRGIRQVFSEMIADLADFPDRVAKSRKGRLAAASYDAHIWSKGCEVVDLTVNMAWSKSIEIAPLAARCLRVKLPPAGLDMSGTDAKLITPNLPPQFVITARGIASGCDDLEAGTRGEVLSEQLRFEGTLEPGRCIAKWAGYYLPLNVNDPNGLKGFQTIVLANVADDPTVTQSRRFAISITRPEVKGSVDVAQTVKQPGRKVKRRLPRPKPRPGRTSEPQLGLPVMVEPEAPGPCDPDAAAIFECGDTMTISFTYGDMANIAMDMEAMRTVVGMDRLPAAFSPEGGSSIADIIQASKGSGMIPGELDVARLMSGGLEGGTVNIKMQRLEPDQSGTFPAQVTIDWAGADGFAASAASLAPTRLQQAGECVVAETLRTTASVTIMQNNAGVLMGSVKAQFHEPNSDDLAACRMPYVAIGSAEFSFTLGGIVTVGNLGDYLVTTDQMQKTIEARLENAMATLGVDIDIDDTFEADGDDVSDAEPVQTAIVGGAFDAWTIEACVQGVTRSDFDEAMDRIFGEMAQLDPELFRQMREQYLADWEGARQMVCVWKASGAIP